MSTDARAQKLWAVCEPGEDHLPAIWLGRFESAGMAVIDLSDEAMVRRIAGCTVVEESARCPCGPHPSQLVCAAHEEYAQICPEYHRVLRVLVGENGG